jgi:predicted nucleotidyltransferase
MKNSILEKLKEIEIDNGVTILFAIESGSRAWGFHSPDSDYDVRFVYMHRKDWYLTIEDKKDFIELPVNEVFDVNGYDIRKMLRFFRTTNGKIYEWIQSPTIYTTHGSFLPDVRALIAGYYSPKAGLHHYLGLTRNTLENDLKSDKVKLKKYFYALRPVLAAYWIALKNECPPMEFGHLRTLVTDDVLNENIDALLKQKVEVDEKFLIEPNKIIHQFIEDTFAFCDAHTKTLQPKSTDITALNQLFRKTIGL